MARDIVIALAPDGTNLFRLVDRGRALADALGAGRLHVVLLGLRTPVEERARRLEQAYRLCRAFGGDLHVYYDEGAMLRAVKRLCRSGRGALGAVVDGDAEFGRLAHAALPALYDREYQMAEMGGLALSAAYVHG